MKKVLDKLFHFGHWGQIVNGERTHVPGDGWQVAPDAYEWVAGDVYTGWRLRPDAATFTATDLCTHFLTVKKHKLDAGEISPSHRRASHTTDRLVAVFGKGPRVNDLRADDFAHYRADLAWQYGPVRLGNEVQTVRSVLGFGAENRLVENVVRVDSAFRKTMRLYRVIGG